jgi:glyoxylase-like metal-dependent hydrolase (beta-lactamase superfamily II)
MPYPKFALPSITFDQSTRIHFNDEEILAVHYPNGHTDGDSVIFFTKANVVHLGDHFFANRFPFVDMESGGSVQGLTKNIGDIINRLPADAKIIPVTAISRRLTICGLIIGRLSKRQTS